MIRYEIEGASLPVLICYPEEGQTLVCQNGAMSFMSPNMEMNTTAGGIKKALGRIFTGESIFLNDYTPKDKSGMIAFASTFPGSILPFSIKAGEGIIVQKRGFLAMEKGMELSLYFQKKLSRGFFGGEGFIMQKITGEGTAFIEIDGYCKVYELGPGESIIADTGYLAAMSESCTMEIETVKGVKNMFLGGEGIFHTRITGPGKVYLQTMPLMNTAKALSPYLEIPSESKSSDGGGIKINFNP